MEFLAKSNPAETLTEHTNRVCAKLGDILRLYGDLFTDKEKQLLHLACKYHDYGKIESVFQDVVRGTREKIEFPHGFLSGLFLYEDDKEKGLLDGFSESEKKALFTAIHYHHNRLDDKTSGNYSDYANSHLRDNYKIFMGRDYSEGSFRYLRNRLFVNDPAKTLKVPDEIAYRTYLLLKGILNKADYAASGSTSVEIEAVERLTPKVTATFGKSLRPAQVFMRDHKDENIVVIAPTGSGKTEGAILWLDDSKGFYTLPLKVSAGAIYHRIYDSPSNGNSRGYGFKEVGLLHSDSISEYLGGAENDSSESELRSERRTLAEYRAVRSLAYPLTITTVDQLFKFVFKALGTEIFAATLKYSRVIIDEMQMYEPRILAMLIYGLKTVSLMGGKFAVITATLPEFVRNKLEKEGVPFAYGVFPNDMRRHIIRLQPDEFNDSFDLDAIRESGKTNRVLVICNTVIRAQELKRQLPEARLLHSRFTKEDRESLEKEILEFQDNEKNPKSVGIWISTQLVEASLDIDFDILHTELCSADSLLQRMGRCWRSRTYTLSEPNIFVYDHGHSRIYDKDIFERSKKFLAPYENRIFTEREKLDYINAVFSENEIRETDYYREFQRAWSNIREVPPMMYSKFEADNHFRNIQSASVIPETVYNEHRDEIEECSSIMNNRKTDTEQRYRARQRLERFVITINPFSSDGKLMDRTPIEGTIINRTRAKYSSKNELGLGLLREEADDDGFL